MVVNSQIHSSEELQAEKQVYQSQIWSKVVLRLRSTRPRKMQKELELLMRKIKQLRFRQQSNIRSKSRQDKYHLVWSIFQETQIAEEPAHLREKLLP